jgi:hypothetical protein
MSKSSTSWSTRNQRIQNEHRAAAARHEVETAASTGSEDGSLAPSQLPMHKRASLAALEAARRRPPRALPLVPEAVGVYAKTLTCTHGGKPRSRSQGLRQRQHFRSMQCPAKVNLVAKKLPGRDARDASAWQVVVTRHVATHNHPLDAETYMQYPQNRRVDDPHVLETVDALSRAGVKQRQIRDYLAERAPHKRVTKSDVHNLLSRMKRKRRYSDEPAGSSGESAPMLAVAASPQTEAQPDDMTPLTVAPAAGVLAHHLGWTQGGAQVGPLAASPGGDSAEDTAEQSSPTDATEVAKTDEETLMALTMAQVERSGSFRLRVDRLEEQNIALYEENMRLRELTATQSTRLQDAQVLVAQLREQIARLTGSESSAQTTNLDQEEDNGTEEGREEQQDVEEADPSSRDQQEHEAA